MAFSRSFRRTRTARIVRAKRAAWRARAAKTRTWKRKTWKARRTKVARGFAASPAGKHRKLGVRLLGIAKKARASGNRRHATAMTRLGKRALALSRRETSMWRKGKALRRRSFATHRALKAW